MAETRKPQSTPPLWTILAGASDLLTSNPARAEQRALEALKSAPAQPHCLTLLVGARRAAGDTAGARALLEEMAAAQPNLAAVHLELGQLLAELGETQAAISALSRVVELEPDHPTAWRTLGDLLALTGDTAAAAHAFGTHFNSSMLDVRMLEYVMTLESEQIENAATMLREFLKIHPTDVNALRLMSRLYARVNRFHDAERVLARILDLAPGFVDARRDYGLALHRQSKWDEESLQIDVLLANDPDNTGYRYLKATALYRTGRFHDSIAFCEGILRDDPDNLDFQMAYASALRMVGRQNDCIAVLRNVVERDADRGDAWWALANLKTFHFAAAEMRIMRDRLARGHLTPEGRYQMHFALGKALEDEGLFAESFKQYRHGNDLVRERRIYNSHAMTEHLARTRTRFDASYYSSIAGQGCLSSEPIFIISLPRSGSTLVEQILSSHPDVESAGEATAMPVIAARLAEKAEGAADEQSGRDTPPFSGENLERLGEEYLERMRRGRPKGRPRFTDKLPNNFQHLDLICAALPNASIVAVHRHPVACCFSMYKQLFPFEQGPFYDFEDLARYYRDFVDMTSHFDAILPGRIHHLFYEDLVREPEAEIRRMLRYCGLPFAESCLRFYESERPVMTASSEQVRQPLYANANEQWRNFEAWLGPLKSALGSALSQYPDRAGNAQTGEHSL